MSARELVTTGISASLRRAVNDNLSEIARTFDDGQGEVFEFLCECEEENCAQLVRLTLAQYRSSPPGSVRGH